MRQFDGIVALLMVVGAVSFLVYFFVTDFKTALLFTVALVSVSYIKQYFFEEVGFTLLGTKQRQSGTTDKLSLSALFVQRKGANLGEQPMAVRSFTEQK